MSKRAMSRADVLALLAECAQDKEFCKLIWKTFGEIDRERAARWTAALNARRAQARASASLPKRLLLRLGWPA